MRRRATNTSRSGSKTFSVKVTEYAVSGRCCVEVLDDVGLIGRGKLAFSADKENLALDIATMTLLHMNRTVAEIELRVVERVIDAQEHLRKK